MISLADLEPGMEVLEPSAGEGAIASTVAGLGCVVDCIEQNAKRAGVIYEAGYARTVTLADFLAVPQRAAYDRVIMNPPFADKADIAHVRHALGFLRPGGLLIAVMANGAAFREDRATASFRDLVSDAGGTIEPLPEGAFKESGTGVRTVLAVIPAANERELAVA
jgi:predicted RNA methylase